MFEDFNHLRAEVSPWGLAWPPTRSHHPRRVAQKEGRVGETEAPREYFALAVGRSWEWYPDILTLPRRGQQGKGSVMWLGYCSV
jgi:hypothetical protein